MKIKIIAVGKKPSAWIREAEQDYLTRLKNFTDSEVVLVGPEDENSLGTEKALTLESAKLAAKIKPSEFVIACDRKGQTFASEQFAKKIQQLLDQGQKLCFLIGGSNGLSPEILKRANLKISFSPLTFPHELFRVLLLEQIYRGFMIMSGRKYHK